MRKLWLQLGSAGCLCLSLMGTRGDAADLRVNPTLLVMAKDQHDAEISFRNLGDRPLQAQVHVYRWIQEQGQDRLIPARDLAVSPPRLEIPPQAQHVVRVIRLAGSSETTETSYRIIVDELPDTLDGRGKTSLLRYSAPIFVASADGTAPGHRLTARVCQHGGRTLLRIDNHGSGHARLADLAYVAADGRPRWRTQNLSGYVLPGQYRHWPLPGSSGRYDGGRFRARVNDAAVPQTLPAGPAH